MSRYILCTNCYKLSTAVDMEQYNLERKTKYPNLNISNKVSWERHREHSQASFQALFGGKWQNFILFNKVFVSF
jgi:hypothetical protein